MGNLGRDETYRSRMLSSWCSVCLYLYLGSLAAECLDPKSIWLQVWFLILLEVQAHTVGKSDLILCFQALNINFPFYWWHSRGPQEPGDTEPEPCKGSTCHLSQLHKRGPHLFCSMWYCSQRKRDDNVNCLIQTITSNKRTKLSDTAGLEPLPPWWTLGCTQEHNSPWTQLCASNWKATFDPFNCHLFSSSKIKMV